MTETETSTLRIGEAVRYMGRTRITDDALAFAHRNPTKMAAWVLRSIIEELMERRAVAGGQP